MNATDGTPIAEAADRRWHMLAVAMLLLAAKAATTAAIALIGEPVPRYLDVAEAVFALAAVAIVVWMLYVKFARIPSQHRRQFLHIEGYVRESLRKACYASWATTFILLSMLGVMDRLMSRYPAEVFVNLIVAIMLSVFSLTFFWLNRPIGDDADA